MGTAVYTVGASTLEERRLMNPFQSESVSWKQLQITVGALEEQRAADPGR
jgi:hypothetical protein